MKLKITASMLVLLGLVGCGGGGDGGDTADTTTGGGTTTGGTTTGGTTTGGTTTGGTTTGGTTTGDTTTGGTTTGGTTTGGGTTNVTMASRLSTTVGRSIGIKADGTVLAWGADGGFSIAGTPVAGTAATQVSGLPAVAAVSVSNRNWLTLNYGLAVSADGRAFGWGQGNLQGLSFGTVFDYIYSAPTQIDQLTGIVQIKATPAGITVALKSDGTLWVLGGVARPITAATLEGAKISAKQVIGVSGVSYIGGGIYTDVLSKDSVSVVDNAGRVYVVYINGAFSSSLTADAATTSVEQVNGLPAISKISCAGSTAYNSDHCLALAVDGKVWSWGSSGGFGQIGDGGASGRTIPVMLSGISGIVDVATTDSNSFAVGGNGKVYSWGNNNYSTGLLGRDAATGGNLTPAEVLGVSDVVEIAAGTEPYLSRNVLVRTKSGSVWGWGDNAYGELGDGSTKSAKKPVQAVGINLN